MESVEKKNTLSVIFIIGNSYMYVDGKANEIILKTVDFCESIWNIDEIIDSTKLNPKYNITINAPFWINNDRITMILAYEI